MMNKSIIAASLLIFSMFSISVSSLNAQKEIRYIGRNDMKAYMQFLASDELAGRETGKPGNEVAARYIQTNLVRLGLNPRPEGEPFLQAVPFNSYEIRHNESYIKSYTADGSERFSTDSILSVLPVSSTIDIEGDLVFAGYAWQNSNTGYSDLAGLDLKNRIVMVMTRNPDALQNVKGKDEYLFDEKIEQAKFMTLLPSGPKAVIFVYDPVNSYGDPWKSGIASMLGSSGSVSLGDKPPFSLPFRIFFITRHTADRLLAPSGNSLATVHERIMRGEKPVYDGLSDVKISIRYVLEKKSFTGYNVIGVIEGSDPILKNECIVYSAHFDHSGLDENGRVLNGADDDASGSIALLELAEAFHNMKKKPSRSVVFAWVNAEEKGLLGSQYYASNPVIPMEKTILNINIDMIGRSRTPADTGSFMGYKLDVTAPGEVMMYCGPKSTDLINIVQSAAGKTGVKVDVKGRTLPFGGSDHQSFEAKGVPFLFFHSGIHRDLHTYRDDADKIDYDKMENVTRMLFMIGNSVADNRQKFTLDQK